MNATRTNPLFTALATRLAACIEFGLVNQVDAMSTIIDKTSEKLLSLAQDKMTNTDFDAIATRLATVDDTGKGLEQVKTIEKVVRLCNAIALDLESGLCGYMKYTALSTLQNGNAITVRENVCALSKVAHHDSDIFAVREGFKNLARYSDGTGSSQSSQCRQVFNLCGFYESFGRGCKNDKPELNAYGIATLNKLVYKQINA